MVVGNDKVIFLLMGPKGSGKSFIGALLEKNYGIHFLHVEEWVLRSGLRASLDDATAFSAVFELIERGVREAMKEHDALVFESTGLSQAFDRMLQNLRREHQVVTIGVHTDTAVCLHRVRMRDQRTHIHVPDADVARINEAVMASAHPTDHTIRNTDRTAAEVLEDLRPIVERYLSAHSSKR